MLYCQLRRQWGNVAELSPEDEERYHDGAKKGQIESEISEAVIRFEKEFMGRGPTETKTYILEGLVIIRFKGVLTRAEQQLITSEDFEGARGLVNVRAIRCSKKEDLFWKPSSRIFSRSR